MHRPLNGIDEPMASILLTLSLFVLLANFLLTSPAESLQIERNETFGWSHGDGGWSIAPTSDGGYIIAGYTVRDQGSDLWLLKCNSSGIVNWSRSFGGPDDEIGYSVEQTSDGGYIIAGTTESFGPGNERLWLVKTDAVGNLTWERALGGFVSSSGDGGWSVHQIGDGYIVCGYTRSEGAGGRDLWLIRTDTEGREIWSHTYGGSGEEVGFSVLALVDGGFLAAGYTRQSESGEENVFAVRTDSEGRELWNRTYGGESKDAVFSMVPATDGEGYVLCGRTANTDGERDVLLMKLAPDGRELWSQAIGGPGDQVGLSVAAAVGGGYMVVGRSSGRAAVRGGTDVSHRASRPGQEDQAEQEPQDLLLIKISPTGEELWAYDMGGRGEDIGTGVVSYTGGCAILGITESFGAGAEDLWLLRVVLDGQESLSLSSIPTTENVINALPAETGVNMTARDGSYKQESTHEGGVYLVPVLDESERSSSAGPSVSMEMPWESSQEYTAPAGPPESIKKFFK